LQDRIPSDFVKHLSDQPSLDSAKKIRSINLSFFNELRIVTVLKHDLLECNVDRILRFETSYD